MRQEIIHYFTEKEEEFVNLLIEIGMKKNVANMLVFLMNKSPATSREIEHGTDMRQPEVSLAVRYLVGQGWITIKDGPLTGKGRPCKIFSLAVPVEKIVIALEKEKTAEAKNQLALVRKMKDFIA
jgi:predicted transcriptional regulator